jgi:hypothetical protein
VRQRGKRVPAREAYGFEESLFRALARAKEKGLTKSQLLGKSKAQKEEILQKLLEEGKIRSLPGRRPRFFLPEHLPTLEKACDLLEDYLGKAPKYSLHTDKELKSALAKRNLECYLDDALHCLKEEEILLRVFHKRQTFYLYSKDLLPKGSSASKAGREPKALDEDRIWEAYQRLVSQKGYPHVRIAELLKEAQVGWPALREWLLARCRQGKAIPAPGDWSLASPEEREHSLEIRGEPHLLIELLP